MLSSVTLDDANGNPVTIHLDTTTSKRGLVSVAGLVGIGSLRDSKRVRPTGHGGISETRWEDGKSVVLNGEIMSQSSVGDALNEFRIVTAPMLATLDTGPALLKWQEGIPGTAAVPPTTATTSYKDEVLADAPVAYYRLAEPSGTTAADIGSGAHAGTYVGTPTLGVTSPLTGDPTDKAITLASASSQCVTATSPSAATNNWAIECWVKLPSLTNQLALFAFNGDDSAGGGGWGMGLGNGVGSAGLILTGYLGNVAAITSGYSFADTNWHHVIMTRESGTIKWYVDGVQTVSTSATVPLAGTAALRIGCQRRSVGGDYRFLDGSVDEVAVYSTALTAARAATHFAAAPLATVAGSAGSPGVAGGLALQRLVKLDGDVSPTLQEAAATLNYQAAFYAEDTRAYSQTLTTVNSSALSTLAGGKAYLKTYNRFYAAASGGVATCTNAGNRPTPPILRILGGCTNPVITRLSNQAKLSIIGTIGTGDYLELDVAKRTVKLNGSSNATNLLDSPNSDWASMEVPAGTETYTLRAASNDSSAALTVFYRSAYA